MKLGSLLAELGRRDPLLARVGWLHFGLAAVMLAVAPFDHRVVTGLNPWIKPIKFALSIGVYCWTVAWLGPHARGPRWAHAGSRWGIAIAMVAEMACIGLQAARGTTSHYNVSTPFDFAVFAVMAGMILLNTLCAALLFVLFLGPLELPSSYAWGIRLGFVTFLAGSLEGLRMIFHQAHTIGAPDGGPGLPFVGWSTRAGDLRVAHLIGLHALQILPLAGFALGRLRGISSLGQALLTWTLGVLYAGAMVLTLRQALAGHPLIPLAR